MNHLFLYLLLFHILGDFYLQSDQMSKGKQTSWIVMTLHCFLYTVSIFIPLFFLGYLSVENAALFSAAIGILHFIADTMKRYLTQHKVGNAGAELKAFIIDQLFHGAVLIGMAALFYPVLSKTPWIPAVIDMHLYYKGIQIFTAMLIGYKPTAILITLVLKMFPKLTTEEDETDGAGRTIGILERETLIVLAFWQQFSAIGFVLAAKSLARFKQLEKQPFAEKYLIGTLTSAFTALLAALIIGKL